MYQVIFRSLNKKKDEVLAGLKERDYHTAYLGNIFKMLLKVSSWHFLLPLCWYAEKNVFRQEFESTSAQTSDPLFPRVVVNFEVKEHFRGGLGGHEFSMLFCKNWFLLLEWQARLKNSDVEEVPEKNFQSWFMSVLSRVIVDHHVFLHIWPLEKSVNPTDIKVKHDQVLQVQGNWPNAR